MGAELGKGNDIELWDTAGQNTMSTAIDMDFIISRGMNYFGYPRYIAPRINEKVYGKIATEYSDTGIWISGAPAPYTYKAKIAPIGMEIQTVNVFEESTCYYQIIAKNAMDGGTMYITATAADGQTAVSIHVLQGEREMAAQNRTLGKFDLVGIPAAPRGVPQIEVTFDIDANGIVHVSAKDLGTGKEQHIRIESSSGLSDSEIERMVKEAEANAAADKAEREKVEVQNEADSMIYQTEKTLKEMGDKISAADKQAIEDALAALKREKESGSVESIKAKTEELKQASYKVAEEMYKAQAASGAASAAGNGTAGNAGAADNTDSASAGNGPKKGSADDVDYEIVDDEK